MIDVVLWILVEAIVGGMLLGLVFVVERAAPQQGRAQKRSVSSEPGNPRRVPSR